MKNTREISLGLLTLFISISLISFSQSQFQFQFQENKGQLPNSVFSKVKVPGGSIFIEQGKFLYSFYNSKQVQEKHDLIRKEDWIDAHSFSATFVNSLESSEIKLSEKSNYFENFYTSKIQVDDVLRIEVRSMMPEAAIIYNRVPQQASRTQNISLLQLEGYLVSSEHTINFPVLGTLNASGTTLELENMIDAYLDFARNDREEQMVDASL